ncbi:hypothetical protein [Rheinheimera hassiensis]|uniref:hypothetical protein n=1 Tax=Rheinheimera hassiensis TaxID=1193627 RepID=UPI001F057A02|nr:hypothetical protein [Rheinheimera hassiensis]
MDEKSAVVAEIEREVKARYRYSKFDFVLNHLLLLLVVVASSYPAFAQIFGDNQPKLTAAIAAIPAFVLLFQRTFKWEQRGEWHWDYRRRLIAILREVRDQGLSDSDASKKLNLLEEELAGSFPGVNYPASKEKQ